MQNIVAEVHDPESGGGFGVFGSNGYVRSLYPDTIFAPFYCDTIFAPFYHDIIFGPFIEI